MILFYFIISFAKIGIIFENMDYNQTKKATFAKNKM